MSWPTPDDLRVLLGQDSFSVADAERAQLLIDLAVGMVENEAGQPLLSAETSAEVDGSGTDVLVLPRWPVTAVAEVTVGDGDPLDPATYRHTTDGRLERVTGRWPSGRGNVAVTFTAGFVTISNDLKRVVLSAASRGWAAPSGVRQESLGDHSVTYQEAGVNLSTDELRVVRRYSADVPR